ncbi:MAG: VWA domain-containing protein, partial [Candidatus Omnitrophota bacterium]
WVLLFLPVVILAAYFLRKRENSSNIRFSAQELLQGFRPTFKLLCARNLIYLRAVVIGLFIVSLARPRLPLEGAPAHSEGIDIVLAVDCSGSMLAEDFKIGMRRQNRLEIVKQVVREFISGRTNDRIGLVAFSARAYTVCPLTLDHNWLVENLERVQIGMIEDGTAVGSAISSSLNRLKDVPAKSKVIILLTDGVNNAGKISPLTAADTARALGVKIYSIGAGTKGMVPYPVKDFFGRTVYQQVQINLDEDMLKQAARKTNGKYFRATDTESLRKIYQEIDALEKRPIEDKGYQEYKELFGLFLLPAIALLLLEVILSNTVLRKIP